MLTLSTAGETCHAKVCPPKLPLFVGDPGPHLIHGFLGSEATLQNDFSIDSASSVFARLTNVSNTDTQQGRSRDLHLTLRMRYFNPAIFLYSAALISSLNA